MKIGYYITFIILVILFLGCEYLLIFAVAVFVIAFIAVPADKKHRNNMRAKFREKANGNYDEYVRLCRNAMIKTEDE